MAEIETAQLIIAQAATQKAMAQTLAELCLEQGIDGDAMITIACGITIELAARQMPLDGNDEAHLEEIVARLRRGWAAFGRRILDHRRTIGATPKPTTTETGHA